MRQRKSDRFHMRRIQHTVAGSGTGASAKGGPQLIASREIEALDLPLEGSRFCGN